MESARNILIYADIHMRILKVMVAVIIDFYWKIKRSQRVRDVKDAAERVLRSKNKHRVSMNVVFVACVVGELVRLTSLPVQAIYT